jgi:hypothetical protein
MLKKRRLSQSREVIMTLPDERYRAVQYTEQFLKRLAGGEYPRTPKAVRDEARHLLRHYPSDYDLDRAEAGGANHVFQKRMEPLYKMVLQKSLEDQVDEDYKL